MNPNWQPLGHIAPGGTVINLVQGPEEDLWAAALTGLFRKQDHHWTPVSRGMSLTQVADILSIRKTLFVAGWPDGIIYSTTKGGTWHKAWIDQLETSINCFTVSPNYDKDRVLLAGTQGKGILRTTDGGRHWKLSNFGLRGFSVYALNSVGVQQSFRDFSYIMEITFAGTDDGVYQSPNGGRAWRPAGSETAGQTILTLALSHSFSSDQTLFAGSESGKLFHSVDGGGSWDAVHLEPGSVGAINCLLWAQNGDLFVGTSEAGILSSSDGGDTWNVILPDVPPVLMLKQINNKIYAGFPETGMMVTDDFGRTWTVESELVARRFQWLLSPKEGVLVAAGPDEGIWISTDQGSAWQPSSWSAEKPILGISAGNGVILAASPQGFWRSTDLGKNWSLAHELQLNLLPFYLSQSGDFAWAAGDPGQFWFSKDQGQSWEILETDFTGFPVIGIMASHNFYSDQTIFVGVRNISLQQIQIWRSIDGGKHWSKRHTIMDQENPLHFAVYGEDGNKSVIGTNTQVIKQRNGAWDHDIVTSEDSPISALAVIPGSDKEIVALADQVLFRNRGKTWHPFGTIIQGQSIVALHLVDENGPNQTLFALSRDGMIWRCEF